MKISLRFLLVALVLAAAACAAPTSPEPSAADATLDGDPVPTSADTTSYRGPNTFGSGN